MINLSAAGLTSTEAKCYQALLTRPAWKPSELAKSVSETRTNCYKILDNLVSKGLAERIGSTKVLTYRATNPSHLLDLAAAERDRMAAEQKKLEMSTQSLMSEYIKTHEQPGIRFFRGKDEIAKVFEDIANSSDEVMFIHTGTGAAFFGFAEMHNLRMLAPNAGVRRRALTPDTHTATRDYETFDETVKLTRTWLKESDYTAPVEWGVYGNTVYIISYGDEAIATTIESANIATAFRQIFKILERGQRAQPWYDSLPRRAEIDGVNKKQI